MNTRSLVVIVGAVLGLTGCMRQAPSAPVQVIVPQQQEVAWTMPELIAPPERAPVDLKLPPSMGLPLVISFSGPVPASVVETTRKAAAVWNHGLGEEVVRVGPAERGQPVQVVMADDLGPEASSLVLGQALRSEPGDIWRIELSPQTLGPLLKGTLVHELGHMLGLDHSLSPSSVMYQKTVGIDSPNAEDFRLARRGVDDLKLELENKLAAWRHQANSL